MDQENFEGGEKTPELTPEQAAHERRQKQKAEKHERCTKHLTTLSQSHPEAHAILKEYIEYEIYTQGIIIAQANDSDMLLKYSGAMKVYNEILEKLDVYKEFA